MMTSPRSSLPILTVRLHGRDIGALSHIGGDRMLFAFNEAYIEDKGRATLSLGFKAAYGELITEFPVTRTRALPFFSNLLPEGHMRAYLAERANVNPVREFHLLKALGLDLPGAVTIVAADDEAADGDGGAGSGAKASVDALRFSLAGVQLKFSALLEARGGLTIPARGLDGDWIVKLPSREFEAVPENEFSMMTLARMVGVDTPPVRLVDMAGIGNLPQDCFGAGDDLLERKAFAIKRFDRGPDGARIHIEDFAQIFGLYPEDKYKRATMRRIAQVIGAEAGNEAIGEFVRRLTFNVLIGNADMHVKNWSLIYPDRRNAALAPAYDFASTIPYIRDESFALKFSRTKRFDGFNRDELAHLAAGAELPGKLVLDAAAETVTRFQEAWAQEQAHLPLTRAVREGVNTHLGSLHETLFRG